MSRILSWEGDRFQILRKIETTHSFFKIVLKTRNDRHFLKAWIIYYSKLVGLENVVIFDNSSTDEDVLRIYDEFAGLLVVRFTEFYDDLHAPGHFSELYSSLRTSSVVYALFDTDEFLVGISGGRVISPLETITKMGRIENGDFIPTVWVANRVLRRDVFTLGRDFSVLYHGISWGKPILLSNSRLPLVGRWNHNCEIVQAGGHPAYNGGLFLLHMSSLFPEQRISANKEKLIARGFLTPTCSIRDIANMDLSHATPRERFYVNEIVHFSGIAPLSDGKIDEIGPGDFRIGHSGILEGARETLAMLASFNSSFREHATNILRF